MPANVAQRSNKGSHSSKNFRATYDDDIVHHDYVTDMKAEFAFCLTGHFAAASLPKSFSLG